jgi:hypothetical protein
VFSLRVLDSIWGMLIGVVLIEALFVLACPLEQFG